MSILLVPLAAVVLAQSTVRVSVATDGTEGDNDSTNPRVSADGRYVVFQSGAGNLVANDTNHATDVFWHDRVTGETRRVSVRSAGGESNGNSFDPAISADGQVIAFTSEATNLIGVGNDTNGAPDVFVRDLTTSQTLRMSKDENGNESPAGAYSATISGDGRKVAFISRSPLVASDANGRYDIYLRDRTNGTTSRVTVAEDGSDPDNDSYFPTLSRDGLWCAFESFADNFAGADTNSRVDVYARDLAGAINVRVSLADDGSESAQHCITASISDDGRFVAFVGRGDDLVPADGNGSDDVFVRDLAAGTLEMVSVDSAEQIVPYGGSAPAISADGRFVAFTSRSHALVDGDANGLFDIFVRDRTLGITTRVSVTDSGGEATGGASIVAALSADGSIVAIESSATDLVSNDTNGHADVFVRERDLAPASWSNYGSGLGGSNGVPGLVASASPLLGSSLTLDLDNSAPWFTVALMLVGGRATIPGYGGTLLVAPVAAIPIALPPGTLRLAADVPPDELLAGAIVDLQALELDAGAPRGVSLTPGLELVLGF